jgi:TolB-like protein
MPGSRPSARSQTASPTKAAVESQLGRILASESFTRAKRASEFLHFIVDKTLNGSEDALNGQTIAVEVFGRDMEFDAAADPLVRVEAGRVRQRLAEYYMNEGQDDRVIIEVPRGAYVARFSLRPRKGTGRMLRRVVAAFAALAILATAIVLQDDIRDRTTNAPSIPGPFPSAASGPRLLITPFRNVSGDGALDYFAFGLTEEIILRLNALDVDVIAGLAGFRSSDAELLLDDLLAERAFDYMMTGTIQSVGPTMRITARLVETASGSQVWTMAFDEVTDVANLLALQSEIAERVATIVSVPYGPVFEREGALAAKRPPRTLASYQCVLRSYYYSHFIDPADYRDTVACLEMALAQDPGYADAWAALANMLIYAYRMGYGQEPEAAHARALEAARMALDIDGSNSLAILAMVRVSFLDGDIERFEYHAERLLDVAPNDPLALAIVGSFFVTSNRPDRGLPLLDRALELSFRPPGWFYLGYAVDAIRREDYANALRWAQRTDMPNWYYAPLFMASTAALSGDFDLGSRYLARTLEMVPDLAAQARGDLGLWQFDAPTLDRILEGLRLAGLEVD